ncbi:hypothetical protein PRIPAC_93673 [Pristionchus pacificus]|uniref:Uncharacterized protein n=1 Tax=Pristionchus pacificus TaxID=54126 RepID=A0A454XVZ0_PRIPA|nr:hypothetical protein PRIPAC_93673 [Pristionchus pacificus]|eukprot:PDM67617.1 hypothetical protein PRIPAC_45661 [Pristionchus pacificus]
MHTLTILLLSSLALMAQASHQTVGVRGTFMCGDKPLVDAEVSLWDRDRWPDADDRLSTVHTDKNGHFEIFGTDDEWLSIEPVLKIYHRCNNKGWFNLPGVCKRKNSFEIPTSYINKGQQVGKWYEMGTMNMEAKHKDEDSKCT